MIWLVQIFYKPNIIKRVILIKIWQCYDSCIIIIDANLDICLLYCKYENDVELGVESIYTDTDSESV